MAEITKVLNVAKYAIPPSCFKIGGLVRANVKAIDGIEFIDMTIAAITLDVATEIDAVTVTFDDTHLPIDGDDLDPCNIISFSCGGCGCSQWCREVFGPAESLIVGDRHVGFLERQITASYVFLAIPEITDSPVQLDVLVGNIHLISSAILPGGSENIVRVPRSSFNLTNFPGGVLPADANVEVQILKTGSVIYEEGEPGYEPGYEHASPAAKGLELCIAGTL